MAGHYGQQLVTYGQTNSTYGSWGVSDSPPGGGRRHRGRFSRLRTVNLSDAGHLRFRVRFIGFGRLHDAAVIGTTVELSGVPALEHRADLFVTRRDLSTIGGADIRPVAATVDGQLRLAQSAAGHVSRSLTLTRISDPPDLWVLLDMPELV